MVLGSALARVLIGMMLAWPGLRMLTCNPRAPEVPAQQPAPTEQRAEPAHERAPPAAPDQAQPAKPAFVQPGAPDAPITSADDLLHALETADDDLSTLTADIVWSKTHGLGGDTDARTGTLYFEDPRHPDPARGRDADPRGLRRFAAIFTTTKIGERLDPDSKHYIFDGRWLAEKVPTLKKLTRTEVVGGGRSFDPLKLGEGPMPIPIGQKRDDIVTRYDATLLDAETDLVGENEQETAALRGFAAGCLQLKLLPRPGADQDQRFSEIRLWYKRGTTRGGEWLPRMVRAFSGGGEGVDPDVDTLQLVNVEINRGVPAKVFDATAPEGWDVTVR